MSRFPDLSDDFIDEYDSEAARIALRELREARILIGRMKDQMEVEMWKRGGIVNFPPSYRAAIVDAVKFLWTDEDEENK